MAIDYGKAYQQFIDEELACSSNTQWMTAVPGQIKYDGGKEIKIAELKTTGLGNYDDSNTDGSAYPQGSVSSTWSTHTLTMDRGVKFALDRISPKDFEFMATAENVIREFTRSQLIKEQDTYRINKIFKAISQSAYADKNTMTGTITKANAISELLKLLSAVQNNSEQLRGFVAIVNQDLKTAFMEASTGTYSEVTFGNKAEINGIQYDNVMMVNDLPCLFAPSNHMVTDIVVNTGRGSTGEILSGISPAENGKKINFIVASYDAPMAVSKIDSLKQFPPEENQLFDGTAIQARYLYDLYVPTQKLCAVGAHTVA